MRHDCADYGYRCSHPTIYGESGRPAHGTVPAKARRRAANRRARAARRGARR